MHSGLKRNKIRNLARATTGRHADDGEQYWTLGERFWVRGAIKDKRAMRWNEHMRVVGESGAARKAWLAAGKPRLGR